MYNPKYWERLERDRLKQERNRLRESVPKFREMLMRHKNEPPSLLRSKLLKKVLEDSKRLKELEALPF
jgi:hypothetical protein